MGIVGKGAQPPKNAASIDERCREVNQTLAALYKNLNDTWEQIEKKLRTLVPPREVWFAYHKADDDPRSGHGGCYCFCLGLIKYRGDWRICRGMYYEPQEGEPESWKPIVECSVSERVEAVKHVDGLRDAILDSAERSVPTVTMAIAELAKALERI
ncbi:MAG: hypothetical protein ACO1RA_21165 [Planctomycetaceae bacterium]